MCKSPLDKYHASQKKKIPCKSLGPYSADLPVPPEDREYPPNHIMGASGSAASCSQHFKLRGWLLRWSSDADTAGLEFSDGVSAAWSEVSPFSEADLNDPSRLGSNKSQTFLEEMNLRTADS